VLNSSGNQITQSQAPSVSFRALANSDISAGRLGYGKGSVILVSAEQNKLMSMPAVGWPTAYVSSTLLGWPALDIMNCTSSTKYNLDQCDKVGTRKTTAGQGTS
jgi:hypothetical protein